MTTGIAGEQVGGADTPVAAALALVALAGAAAVLLVRNRTRRLIGVLLVGVSVGIFAAFLALPDDVTYTVYAVADGGSELRRSVLGLARGLRCGSDGPRCPGRCAARRAVAGTASTVRSTSAGQPAHRGPVGRTRPR